ncbi:uncharacterized protein LOC143283164 [Babylonia areolata]|uniref:uncharacterized protein LOC143283164 n=1 Tax=Babylonia areolata TaxID=304850 RepID=UPI003FCEF5BC
MRGNTINPDVCQERKGYKHYKEHMAPYQFISLPAGRAIYPHQVVAYPVQENPDFGVGDIDLHDHQEGTANNLRALGVTLVTATPTTEMDFNVHVRVDPHRRRGAVRQHGRCGGSPNGPAFPGYQHVERRRRSLEQVPHLAHNARILADCGFFAVVDGNAHQVFCWNCGLQISALDLL